MTRLVGLKLQGVRSIGDEPRVVNFLSPLTIIQGENGTGKTTIIEALNYLTTGSLPSGRLNSFIHSNKLSKKKRVDALIQLQFVDFRGNECTATKRMCAAQGKEKVTTKSDEFTLKITEPNGRTRSESAKVGDFNRQIENLFGVPAAILEHVIFCHQEESTWPLGNSKDLKVKFDAIFEVEKFVKVMGSLKKNVKEFESDLKAICAELPHLQRQMQQMGMVFMQIEETSQKISEISEYVDEKENEKTEMESQFKVLRKAKEEAERFEKEIETKKVEISFHKRTIADASASLGNTPYKGNKEGVMLELESVKSSSEYTEATAQKDKARKKKGQLEREIPKLNRQQKDWQDRKNKIESKRMLLESLQNEREKIITDGLKNFQFNCQSSEFASVLGNEIKKAEESLKTFLSSKETQREELTKKLSDIQAKIVTYTNVDKMKRAECLKIKEQISRLEKELSNAANSSDKITLIQNEIAERNDQMDNIQSERSAAIEALKMKLIALDVFPNVSAEFEDVESIAIRFEEMALANNGSFKEFIRKSVGEKAVLSENTRRDLTERKTQLDEAQTEMTESLQSIQPLKNEQKSAAERLKEFSTNVYNERIMISDRIQLMKNAINRLNDVERQLKQHSADLGSFNVDQCQQKIDEIGKQMDDLREEISTLVTIIAECDNRQQLIRTLEDRLRIFNEKEEISRLESEIVEVKESLPRPSKEIQAEAQKLANQLVKLTNELNKKIGAKTALQQSEKGLRTQINGEQIQNAKFKLKEKVIERVSLENAIQDLKNLAKVMDDSIIQYHAQKMEQINSNLTEMWPRVYQGNDIETIQIKSQTVEGGDKRKSYDYSVVMIIDQIEVEMRDRCSAGQKMLASILIRIALAEVFGGNCPILALDEITTNLDATKVENMGTMLKDLLDAYQTVDNQHNLQLIVITHDKRLVEHLFTACRPEYVYGLSKDVNGVSHIRVHRSIDEDEDSNVD